MKRLKSDTKSNPRALYYWSSITTDGSIGEISRNNYLDAEERVIKELKEVGKPFIMIINSVQPHHPNTESLTH